MCATADTLRAKRMPRITDIPAYLQPVYQKLGTLKYVETANFHQLDNNRIMITVYFSKFLYQQKHNREVLSILPDNHYKLNKMIYTADNKCLLLYLDLRHKELPIIE